MVRMGFASYRLASSVGRRAVASALSGLVRRFCADRNGNVAVLFAISLIPLMWLVGTAVDYSRASAIRTHLQMVADSTVLSLARNAATQSADAVQAQADSFFKASFTRTDAINLVVTATYTNTGGNKVVVQASADTPTSFLGVFGITKMSVGVNATSVWNNTRLRVALVLDNTGSMADNGKMDALKTATNNLIDKLKDLAATNGDVYISIIPFAHFVNVGVGNTSANWIKFSGQNDTWDETNGSCSKTGAHGTPYSNKSDCNKVGGAWTPSNRSNWDGSITDRDQDYDVKSNGWVSGNAATQFPAGQGDPSYPRRDLTPTTMKALSYDWTALKSVVTSMQPGGGTNQAIGLAWGWHSLTSGGPLAVPAETGSYEYLKVVIAFSDGINTMDRWYGNGTSYARQVDDRQAIMCNNMKAAGVTIYAIQVNTNHDPVAAALRDCATDSDKWYSLTSASDIVSTFDQIGNKLTKLRVAK
jgi:Flp pilus assembly protein TadG